MVQTHRDYKATKTLRSWKGFCYIELHKPLVSDVVSCGYFYLYKLLLVLLNSF